MRPNNFDLGRLLLAAIIVFYHCGALSHQASLDLLARIDSRAPVEGFFAISGCLIFASWDRCASLGDYAAKRARRILPGYFGVTLLCVLIALGFTHRFTDWKFLLANASFLNFLHPGIDGVFDHAPENAAMNGSLWTIRIEIMFYFAVPIVVWLGRKLGRDRFFVAVAVLSVLYRYAALGKLPPFHHAHRELSNALPGQMSFFAVGALIYHHLPTFRRVGKWLVLPALAAYVHAELTGTYFLRPLAIPVLVLGFCFLLPEMKGPTRWGDFSYGTYLLHWPIIQSLIRLGLFDRSPWGATALVAALVACAAVVSWNFVEKPFLGRAAPRPAPAAREAQKVAA